MIKKIECDKCRGIGTILCPICDGKEIDDEGNVCRHCGGAGISICNKCDGNGTIEVNVDDNWNMMGW